MKTSSLQVRMDTELLKKVNSILKEEGFAPQGFVTQLYKKIATQGSAMCIVREILKDAKKQ